MADNTTTTTGSVLRDCNVCSIKGLSMYDYATHLTGRRHAINFAQQEKMKVKPTGTEQPDYNKTTGNKQEDKQKPKSSTNEVVDASGIFVRGFNPQMTKEILQEYFVRYGTITKLIHNSHRCYAIIIYNSRESALKALNIKSVVLKGQKIVVSPRMVKKKDKEGKFTKGADKPQLPPLCIPTNIPFEEQLNYFFNEVTFLDEVKHAKIRRLCDDLFRVLRLWAPCCRVCPFGSSVTDLAMKNSDVDIFVDITEYSPRKYSVNNQVALVRDARAYIQRDPAFTNVISIPTAKIALVKFFHVETQIQCDLSFKNPLGVYNSLLVKFLISFDPRIKPLLLVIKYWGQRIGLIGIGKFSNYAMVMLFMFYLQQLKDPLIPPITLLQMRSYENRYVDDWLCSFTTDPNTLNWRPKPNTMSLLQLLYGFFMFCVETDFTFNVLCPLLGRMFSKSSYENFDLPSQMNTYIEKVRHGMEPMRTNCSICIQDPFDHSHCLTSIISGKALFSFRKYCGVAAGLCKEKLVNPNKYSEFLSVLFNDMEKLVKEDIMESVKEIRIIPMNTHDLQCFVDDTAKNTDNNVQDIWYKLVFDAVMHIFENICKLNVTVTHRPPKMQKIDEQKSMSDVSTLQCVGYIDVWSNRKNVVFRTKLPDQPLPALEHHELLSNIILDALKDSQSKAPLVNFLCVLHNRKNPTEVILDFGATSDTALKVGSLILYLKNHLQQLVNFSIERFVKTKKEKS